MSDNAVQADKVAAAFGATLKRLREAKSLSQEALAHRAETSQSYLSRLEIGRRSPGLVTICLLAQALEMTPAQLVQAFDTEHRR